MKVSPYTLKLKPLERVTREFAHWTGKQFSCSCGLSFDIDTPEIPGLPLPECPNAKEYESHKVTANKPQVVVPMVLKRLSAPEQMMIQDYLNRQAELYVTGIGDPTKKDYRAPQKMAPVDGRPIIMSPAICQVACILSQSQIAPEADQYTFEEIVSFMQAGDMCAQMLRVSWEIQLEDGVDPLASAALG